MKRTAREICWLVVLCLGLLITHAVAKPGSSTPATPPTVIDFSELDKIIPTELKEKNTPGTVLTVISGDQVVYQKAFGVATLRLTRRCSLRCFFVSAQRQRCSQPLLCSRSLKTIRLR